MPLKIPEDLKQAIVDVKGENDVRWVVFGYKSNKELKLVKTGDGDYKDCCAAENCCQESELHYALMNSPDGIQCAFIEWTGETVNGMKKSYILRNKGEIDKLIGYVHHRFAGSDIESLHADIHKLNIYEGGKKIGEVKGWDPSIEEWRHLWAETDPVNGWDPNSAWIYKWNPYGDLEFGNLPEEDKPKIKKLYKNISRVPEELLPQSIRDKVKQLAEAENDEGLPKFTEDEMMHIGRVVGMFDLIEAREKGKEVGKIEKHDIKEEVVKKEKPKPAKKMAAVAPPPEEEDEVPDPDEEPEDEDPVPEEEEEDPAPEAEEEVVPEDDEPTPEADTTEKCYFIYTTSLSQNATTASQVYQIKMILDLHQIKYEEVDLYLDGLAGGTRRQEMVAKSGSKVLPQIFINDQFLEGGFDEFMFMNELGEL